MIFQIETHPEPLVGLAEQHTILCSRCRRAGGRAPDRLQALAIALGGRWTLDYRSMRALCPHCQPQDRKQA